MVKPQPAAALLQEERRTRRGAKEKQRVDEGEIDALVVEVAGEEHVHVASLESPRGACPMFLRALAMHCERRDAQLTELAGHEVGVRDAHAEAERPHVAKIIASNSAAKLIRDHLRAPIIAGIEAIEVFDSVRAAIPARISEVDTVVQAVILEGREQLPFERMPQAQ